MTSRNGKTGHDRDGSASETGAALSATIRHADAKAATLLGVVGGLLAMVTDVAAAPQPRSTVAAWSAALIGLASAKAGWHLLAAIRPRIGSRPRRMGSLDPEELAELRSIALGKHREVLRSLPWLLLAAAVAGVALGSAIVDGLWLM